MNISADEAAAKAALAKAQGWVSGHAHQVVTGALILAVLFILHKIL